MKEETNRTILVVDDEKDFREIISTKFKSAGFNVVEAENGQKSIDKAKEIKPDLILLDVNMPDMSGVEVLSKIKSDPSLVNIKILFLTNYGEPQKEAAWLDERYARDIGAVDYIRKSDDLDKIVKEVGALINNM